MKTRVILTCLLIAMAQADTGTGTISTGRLRSVVTDSEGAVISGGW